jgi:hypothetical protein
MKFTHMTDEQINEARGLLMPGVCKWHCVNEDNGTAGDGSPMKILHMQVWDCMGREGNRKTWLIFRSDMMWRVKHFFESAGDLEQYERDELPDGWCIHKQGYALLQIKKAGQGKNGKWYNESVEIYDFLSRNDPRIKKESTKVQNLPPEKPAFDDDLPF